MNYISYYLGILLRGMAMGAADVIPGVSGGTIAFITGIYETLINSIKSVNAKAVQILFKEGFAKAWQHINGNFLLCLFSGIIISIVSLAKGISYLLDNYPQLLSAFFFGLILASAWFIAKQIPKWTIQNIIALMVGTAIAAFIALASPAQAPTNTIFVFFAGCIAICAMILPGISGSFILLLMGMYSHVIGAIKGFDIMILAAFGGGCIVGLLSFSHVLSYMFKHFRASTLSLLTGFMLGSLLKVWPWKNTLQTRINSHGEEVPFIQQNVLPHQYVESEAFLLPALVLIIIGIAAVLLLEYFGAPANSEQKEQAVS